FLLIAGCLLAGCLAGCGGGHGDVPDRGARAAGPNGSDSRSNGRPADHPDGRPDGNPNLPVRAVRLAPAEGARLPRTVAVAGALAADGQVALGLKVAGRIERMAVDLGSRVRRGDLLARLAPADFELRVEQAATALEQARVRLGLAPGDPDTARDLEKTA